MMQMMQMSLVFKGNEYRLLFAPGSLQENDRLPVLLRLERLFPCCVSKRYVASVIVSSRAEQDRATLN